MAEVMTLMNGKRFLRAYGGRCNDDAVMSSEVELSGDLQVIDKVTLVRDESQAGAGTSQYTVFKDGGGYIILEIYGWNPNHGYSWDEAWEEVKRVDDSQADELLGWRVKERLDVRHLQIPN